MIFHLPFLKRGITLTPFLILIPEWARYNKAYLAHEETHVKQQRKYGVVVFWYRYLTNKAFRQTMEVEAYKVEIIEGASLENCAVNLAKGYGLSLSVEEAIKELSR